MKTYMKKWALPLAAAAVLSACASSGTYVHADGSADELVWPNPESTTFNKDRGTFPNVENLKQIRSGMSKDQLYYLIGRPQFNEGFRVTEWNYLFHFNTPGQGTDGVTTCQYKVLFDKNKFARNFYWKAVDPVNAVCPPEVPQPKPAPQPTPEQPTPHRFTLSADALFVFDKGDEANMLPKGKAELDQLAAELRRFPRIDQIRIMGHTDYLGTDYYNMMLSQQRAETVRRYLYARGVPRGLMLAFGMGEGYPVKQCTNNGNRTELIACLQPNRRVEIEVNGISASGNNGNQGISLPR